MFYKVESGVKWIIFITIIAKVKSLIYVYYWVVCFKNLTSLTYKICGLFQMF